jgi:hypothetical protein
MMVIGLAGFMSLTCLSQTSSSASEKPSAAPHTADNSAKKFYQLTFMVQELESERVINSRKYSIIMRGGEERVSIRAGEKVPFNSATGGGPQWQQINVGVDIDCHRLEEIGDGVSIHIKADISGMMETHGENSPPGSLPILRNNQWESSVVVPMKQATVLFSSDDPASKRNMRLVLTVTLIR